jgi:two-component system chemotaxis sensor kinase CheA
MGIKSDLDSNFDFEVVDEFYDHYTMMVESMEVMILDLSKADMYQRSVNELFRIFHNIKSASGFLRIEPMRRLSTFVEEVLDELRQKDKPVSEQTVNWLLEISDIFAAWQDDLRNDNELTHVKYSLLKIPDLDED